MAYQVNRSNSKGGVELSVGRNPAAQINRTEPPDEVSSRAFADERGLWRKWPAERHRSKRAPRQSRCVPPWTEMENDEVLAGVIAGARRGDKPVNDWQTRSTDGLGKPGGYEVGVHPNMVRNQDPSILARKDQLPKNLDEAAEENPVRQPGG